MAYATYEIRNEKSGEVMATDMTPEQVDVWWSLQGDKFFGVRVVENVIEVSPASTN